MAGARALACVPLLLALLAASSCRSNGTATAGSARALRPIPPDLETAEAEWKAAPGELDAVIWYGRRLAYAGRLDEALAVFGQGLERGKLQLGIVYGSEIK